MLDNYKPHLPSDKKYLQTIAGSISAKGPLEEIHFEYLNEALGALGITQNPYDYVSLEHNMDNQKIDQLIAESFAIVSQQKLSEEVMNKVLKAWDYLAQSDQLEKADLIFVFGGAKLNRVRGAVRLYKEGYADKIMFSGQKASYMPDVELSEAEYYEQEAIKLGVPKEAIILETRAKNTPENVLYSADVLKAKNFLPKTIILVSSQYHMRRGYLTFKAVADWHPKLIKYSVAMDLCNRDDFYKIKEGWSYLFYEYIKIYYSRLLRHC
ncbi:MAG: YdcF family protein [Patescibacteria group bacterium]